MIVRRECDEPMARSKKILPCDKDCKRCMACIEITDTGERRHCNRLKASNVALDMKMETAAMRPEPWDGPKTTKGRERKLWTDEETKRLIRLRKEGKTWQQIADAIGKSWAAVQKRHEYVTKEKGWK